MSHMGAQAPVDCCSGFKLELAVHVPRGSTSWAIRELIHEPGLSGTSSFVIWFTPVHPKQLPVCDSANSGHQLFVWRLSVSENPSVPAENDQDALSTCSACAFSLLMDLCFVELGDHTAVSWSSSSSDSSVSKKSLFVTRACTLFIFVSATFLQGCADVAKDTTAPLKFAPWSH